MHHQSQAYRSPAYFIPPPPTPLPNTQNDLQQQQQPPPPPPPQIPWRRQRRSKACLNCHIKKIKCEGDGANCDSCIRNGVECKWVQTKKRGPKP
ncbi:hypothetical protein GQ54DRAFT_254859, partial [Martensiomyces pterosporus]